MTENFQYIYYISLVIECLVFGFIIIGIKRTGQITSDDSQGLNWFSYAFFSWAITGMVSVFALMSKIDEKNTYLLIGHTICSTLTSVCFIKTISYIKITSPFKGEKSIKAFFTNGMLVLFSTSEKNKIVNAVESLTIKDIENQNELNHLNEIIEVYKQQNTSLIFDTIDFSISTGNYSVILTNKMSKHTKEIPFSPSLEPFKRLFRLAVHSKFGNGLESQTLPYSEDGLPKSKIETSPETRNEYFRRFRPKDKSDIKNIAKKNGYPGFTNDFLKLFKDFEPHRIGFSISPDNINLPSLDISNYASPEEIYSLFAEKFTILKKERG